MRICGHADFQTCKMWMILQIFLRTCVDYGTRYDLTVGQQLYRCDPRQPIIYKNRDYVNKISTHSIIVSLSNSKKASMGEVKDQSLRPKF